MMARSASLVDQDDGFDHGHVDPTKLFVDDAGNPWPFYIHSSVPDKDALGADIEVGNSSI